MAYKYTLWSYVKKLHGRVRLKITKSKKEEEEKVL